MGALSAHLLRALHQEPPTTPTLPSATGGAVLVESRARTVSSVLARAHTPTAIRQITHHQPRQVMEQPGTGRTRATDSLSTLAHVLVPV